MNKVILILLLNIFPLLLFMAAFMLIPEQCENGMAGLIHWLNNQPETSIHAICSTSATELFDSLQHPIK
ncbi:hypothetical protein KDD30_21220 (plasmid) [Photobacterium sp. GJ3]|uniref:hypothetical protein n=1 Tax=Photobacterium sp. GJ3 TaxID=2829502 RepID=UPI001B8BA568|nr:hypothetical protein [Photobacterium sp. GJ3]QUJ69294.1 hypothetical protein KDD30_21220 [Photobacterium sp. GJ3]